MHPFVARSLEIALQENGVREEGRANWGEKVREYLHAVAIDFPAPWCAAFVRWCLLRAAGDLGLERRQVPILAGISARDFAYCPNIGAWAANASVLENAPRPGDLFLYYNGVRFRHVGFVRDTSSSHFSTIEGNTNLSGDPEGIGVFKRTRPRTGAYRFVRFGDLLEQPITADFALYLNDRFLFTMPLVNGHSLAPVRPWAEALGFDVAWDPSRQAVLFDGQELDVDVTRLDGVSHAPIRDLVRAAGLQLTVDPQRRRVQIFR